MGALVSCLFLFFLFLSLFCLSPVVAVKIDAQVSTYNSTVQCQSPCSFFNSSIWENGVVPVNGSSVVIRSSAVLYLDSPLVLTDLNITGATLLALSLNSSLSVSGAMRVHSSTLAVFSTALSLSLSSSSSLASLLSSLPPSEPLSSLPPPDPSEYPPLVVATSLEMDRNSGANFYVSVSVGTGKIYASPFNLVPNPTYQPVLLCTSCFFYSSATIGQVFAEQITIGPGSSTQIFGLQAQYLTLLEASQLSAQNITITGNTDLGNSSTLRVSGISYFYNFNATNNSAPLTGFGNLLVSDAPLHISDTQNNIAIPFMGQITFNQKCYAVFRTIYLSSIEFGNDAVVNITASAFTLTSTTGTMRGHLLIEEDTFALYGPISVTNCIQVLAGTVEFGGEAFVNCSSSFPFILANAQLTTNQASIHASVQLTNVNWISQFISILGNVSLSDSFLTVSSNTSVYIAGSFTMTNNSMITLPDLSLETIPIQAGSASINGTLAYSLQGPPKHTTHFTILKTDSAISGKFVGSPTPLSNSAKVHSVIYNTNTIQLEYVHKTFLGKNLWWIAIIVVVSITILAVVGATCAVKRRYNYQRVN